MSSSLDVKVVYGIYLGTDEEWDCLACDSETGNYLLPDWLAGVDAEDGIPELPHLAEKELCRNGITDVKVLMSGHVEWDCAWILGVTVCKPSYGPLQLNPADLRNFHYSKTWSQVTGANKLLRFLPRAPVMYAVATYG